MIFYFTGTGNSLYAAWNIAETQNERLISITEELDKDTEALEYDIKREELLGFVFPVYAWGPPAMVLEFVKRLRLKGETPYVFCVSTCGDGEGKTAELFRKALAKSNIKLNSAFSLIMPNNYLAGFDVDPKDLEQTKLNNADNRLLKINGILAERQNAVFDTVPGRFSWLKSSVINPLFNRFAMNAKQFYADASCTGCGLCEKICPVHSITVKEKPTWSNTCTQCMACINRCPVRAIQIGKNTKNKGRYIHPRMNYILSSREK